MAAHEMRNLLAPLSSSLDILARSASDPAGTEKREPAIEQMRTQLARLNRYVEDLLAAAAGEAGCIRLEATELDICEAITGAIDTVRPAIVAHQHQLSLTVDTPSPPRVVGDCHRLEQVLSNLLLNAANFTPEGGDIALRLECDGREVTVAVRDSGMGIAPEVLPHIFDAWDSGEREVRRPRASTGTGLGLMIARQLVQLHGGTLQAYSPGLGAGSEFVVRLPVASPQRS